MGLVHLFHEGPVEYRRRYLDLTAQLDAGVPFGIAWRTTFGGVARAEIDALEAAAATRRLQPPSPAATRGRCARCGSPEGRASVLHQAPAS